MTTIGEERLVAAAWLTSEAPTVAATIGQADQELAAAMLHFDAVGRTTDVSNPGRVAATSRVAGAEARVSASRERAVEFLRRAEAAQAGLEEVLKAGEAPHAAVRPGARHEAYAAPRLRSIAKAGVNGSARVRDVHALLALAMAEVQSAMAQTRRLRDRQRGAAGPGDRTSAGEEDPLAEMLRGGARGVGSAVRLAGSVIGFGGSIALSLLFATANGLSRGFGSAGKGGLRRSPGVPDGGRGGGPSPMQRDGMASWAAPTSRAPSSTSAPIRNPGIDSPAPRWPRPPALPNDLDWQYYHRVPTPNVGSSPRYDSPGYSPSGGGYSRPGAPGYDRPPGASQSGGRAGGLEQRIGGNAGQDDLGSRLNRMFDGD